MLLNKTFPSFLLFCVLGHICLSNQPLDVQLLHGPLCNGKMDSYVKKLQTIEVYILSALP